MSETRKSFREFAREEIAAGLRTVREMMAQGRVNVCMCVPCSTTHADFCGTVACIGGHLGLVLGMTPSAASLAVLIVRPDADLGLHPLFYDYTQAVVELTGQQQREWAVRRIDRWLEEWDA